MASTKRALANNPIVDVTAIHSSRIVKQQALGAKHQAVKHQAERQATSVECGPSHQAPSKVFPGDRSTSLGPRHSHKV